MKILYYLILILIILPANILPQWIVQHSGNQPFYDSHFLDNQNGWVVGGERLKTTNGGQTWLEKGPIITNNWDAYSVLFLDTLTGFICGNNQIFKTSDGGNNWIVVNNLPYGIDIKSMYFIDSQRGWAAGGNSVANYLCSTLNGGEDWSEVSVPTDNILYSISFFDNLNGYAVGANGFMINTTDGGNTWNPNYLGFNPLNCVQFISASFGWVSGFMGVWSTTTGGNNWTWSFLSSGNIFSIFFIDALHGWAGGDGGIYYSSDGGINWEIVNSRHIRSIFFVNPTNGWASGSDGYILYTTNGGVPVEFNSFTATYSNNTVKLNWSTVSELNNQGFEIERRNNRANWRLIGFKEGYGTTTEIHNYSFTDDLSGTNSSKLYYRLKQVDYDGSFEYSDIVEVDIAPIEFSLSQNYPNPFNPSTTINYSIPNAGIVTIKVYDVLGKEVATLVNEDKPAGNYEVEFNASDLPSGIYFYQLKSERFVEIKKMILLK